VAALADPLFAWALLRLCVVLYLVWVLYLMSKL
jgi:hypothetical protein